MSSSVVSICFNGQDCQITSTTVAELLTEFKLVGKKIAVELNKSIISRDKYSETPVAEGDRVEIIQFVGGG